MELRFWVRQCFLLTVVFAGATSQCCGQGWPVRLQPKPRSSFSEFWQLEEAPNANAVSIEKIQLAEKKLAAVGSFENLLSDGELARQLTDAASEIESITPKEEWRVKALKSIVTDIHAFNTLSLDEQDRVRESTARILDMPGVKPGQPLAVPTQEEFAEYEKRTTEALKAIGTLLGEESRVLSMLQDRRAIFFAAFRVRDWALYDWLVSRARKIRIAGERFANAELLINSFIVDTMLKEGKDDDAIGLLASILFRFREDLQKGVHDVLFTSLAARFGHLLVEKGEVEDGIDICQLFLALSLKKPIKGDSQFAVDARVVLFTFLWDQRYAEGNGKCLMEIVEIAEDQLELLKGTEHPYKGMLQRMYEEILNLGESEEHKEMKDEVLRRLEILST